MVALLAVGRRVALLGFDEWFSSRYRDHPGIEMLDLETDAKAFKVPLPRTKIIPIDEFDPVDFL
jgi:putative heme uptake system protein